MSIGQVLLSNTFNEFRVTVNEISNTVNDLTANVLSGNIIANTITVGEISSNLIPSANVTYDLGSATNRWNDLYLSGNTIFLGDAEISYDGAKITFGVSGSNILDTSNLNASNLNFGTIPDARFPSTLPTANGVNLTFLNASNLGTGTISNARTTAASANGASTIVARDAAGSFTTNVITATTFSGSGASLTNLNASNLASGTVPDARFPSTLPSANGVNLTFLNASNLGTGTIPDARFPSTLPTANGVNLTFLNASNLGTGTISNARTTANSANGASTIVARDAAGSFTTNVITATTFSGSGASLTNLNASNLASGTVPDARFPSTLPSANGVNLTFLNASNLGTGTVAIARGGTGGTTAQAARNNISEVTTSGQYLRGNGTNVLMSAIQASDVPTLNQNTTGTAANVTGTVAIANGGTGGITAQAARNNIAGAVTSGQYLRGNGTNVLMSAIQAGDVPTLNQNTTGTAANVTGTVGVTNGGTGQTTYTNGQLLIGNTTGNTLTKATLTAGSNVTITNGTGSITIASTDTNTTYSAGTGITLTGTSFSIPQAVATTSSVQFGSFGVGTAASGTTGEIRATNNVTAYYSDQRLKENITPIHNALSKICSINGVTFQSNETAAKYGYTNQKIQVGVIAQEVEKVLPQVVVPAPFDIGQNEDGSEYSISGENYLTVQYEKLIPLLIEAIKELKAEVDQLKNSKG